MDEKIRINKYLSEAGFCSRREADSLIQAGRVTVDGHKAEPGEKITSDTVVYVDGKPVEKTKEKVLLLFYKPRGVVCSTKQQRQEMTVTEEEQTEQSVDTEDSGTASWLSPSQNQS